MILCDSKCCPLYQSGSEYRHFCSQQLFDVFILKIIRVIYWFFLHTNILVSITKKMIHTMSFNKYYLLPVLQFLGLVQQIGNDKKCYHSFRGSFFRDLYHDPNQDFALDPPLHFERKLTLGSSSEYQLEAVWK